jgi:hypothetical protein
VISWKWLLILDAITMFILATVPASVAMDLVKPWVSVLLMGLVAVSQQLRARLALPPPTTAMITEAVAKQAPIAAAAAAPEAAAKAAPAAAAAAAPAAARAAAPEAAAAAAPAAAEAAKTA